MPRCLAHQLHEPGRDHHPGDAFRARRARHRYLRHPHRARQPDAERPGHSRGGARRRVLRLRGPQPPRLAALAVRRRPRRPPAPLRRRGGPGIHGRIPRHRHGLDSRAGRPAQRIPVLLLLSSRSHGPHPPGPNPRRVPARSAGSLLQRRALRARKGGTNVDRCARRPGGDLHGRGPRRRRAFRQARRRHRGRRLPEGGPRPHERARYEYSCAHDPQRR